MAATLSPRRRERTSSRACCCALSKVSSGSLVPRCELNAGTATTAIPAGADKIESCLAETPLSPVLAGASGIASGRLLHLKSTLRQVPGAGLHLTFKFLLGYSTPAAFNYLPPPHLCRVLVSLEPDFLFVFPPPCPIASRPSQV